MERTVINFIDSRIFPTTDENKLTLTKYRIGLVQLKHAPMMRKDEAAIGCLQHIVSCFALTHRFIESLAQRNVCLVFSTL